MKDGPDIAYVASLIGEPVRANMLTALMAGRALTASELAHEAGITLQTASSHLGKLEHGGLLRQRKQGRHKYFSLASGEVAATLEALMGLAVSAGHLRTRPGPKDAVRGALMARCSRLEARAGGKELEGAQLPAAECDGSETQTRVAGRREMMY